MPNCSALGWTVFYYCVICIGDILYAYWLAVTAVLFCIRLDCVLLLCNLRRRYFMCLITGGNCSSVLH